MSSARFKITWKTIFLPAIGLVAFVLYIFLFNVDIPKIITIIQQINPYLYLLAAALLILDTFFFTLSWHSLMTFLSLKLSVFRSFLYVWYGIFMDIIIPAESISGEISKAYLVSRDQHGSSGKVVASLVVQRVIGMGINTASLLLGLFFLFFKVVHFLFVYWYKFFLHKPIQQLFSLQPCILFNQIYRI